MTFEERTFEKIKQVITLRLLFTDKAPLKQPKHQSDIVIRLGVMNN